MTSGGIGVNSAKTEAQPALERVDGGLVLSTCCAEERRYAVRRCKQQHAPFGILEGMSPGMRNGDCVVPEPAV